MTEQVHEQSTYFSQSLARGLSIIRSLADASGPLTVSDVASLTDMSRAAARRLLLTLRDLGYADMRDDRWRLRPKVLELGHSWASAKGFYELAQLTLDRTAILTSHSCSIATLEDLDVLFLIRAAPPRLISIRLTVGSKLPAFATSLGKVLLATKSEEELQRRLNTIVLRKYTDSTILSVPALLDEIARVKECGFATVWGEYDPEVASIAVAIPSTLETDPLAVNISMHTATCSREEMVSRYLPILRDVSKEVGAALRAGAR